MRLVSVLRITGSSTRSGIEAGVLTAALAVFCAGTFCFGAFCFGAPVNPPNAAGQNPGQTPGNPASQQQSGAKPPTAAAHSTHSAKHTARHKADKPAPVPPVVAVVPPSPPLPDWPVNDKAQPASVSWNGRDLTIAATNSSLQQILTEVSTATGVKVEGEQSDQHDQRIFGSYGPASARDVLSQLLDGSGYNVLIIGDKGEGTPRELVLTARTHTAPSNPSGNAQSHQNSEDDVQDEPEPQPEQQPNLIQHRFPMQPGQGRSPEQMQQEQQQRLQQQQQNPNPQQQNPQQPLPQQPNN